MAKLTPAERKAAKLDQLKKLKESIAAIERSAQERLGRLAAKEGLVELGLTDAVLRAEFKGIAERFRAKK